MRIYNLITGVKVLFETDASQYFDGADLRYIARGDDGRDYAVKSLDQGAGFFVGTVLLVAICFTLISQPC